MANDINMPNFNLGDDLDSWKSEPPAEAPKEEKAEDKAAKPKLLFEDNLEEKNEPMSSETGQEKPSKKKSKDSSGDSKGPKKTWLWISLCLVIIIGGGVFFLHTQGYLNLQAVLTKVEKIKNSIFGGKTTDSTKAKQAQIDSTKIKQATVKDTSKMKSEAAAKIDSSQKEDLSKSVQTIEKPVETPKEKPEVNKNLLKAPEKPKGSDKKIAEVKKPEKIKIETKKSIKPLEKPVSKKEPSKKVNPALTGKFLIQTSAWKKRSSANLEANKLRKEGFKAAVIAVNLPYKGGKWYRVLVGGYETDSEAEEQLSNIKKKFNIEGIIRER